MWHASIAYLRPNGPVSTDKWGKGVTPSAKAILLKILRSVGLDTTIYHRGKIALHARRSLTDQEIGVLSCEWLAIPAQDEFSEEGLMEIQL